MTQALWRLLALIVSRPRVAEWLIRRAQRTPYTHITSRDGSDTYMRRWWLFNGYAKDSNDAERAPWPWLPSVRVHHILRRDDDEHMHDHPWNARTILLRGYYLEELPLLRGEDVPNDDPNFHHAYARRCGDARVVMIRRAGTTRRVLFEQWHRIVEVPAEGVYTLWFTWDYRGTWGFLVDGVKVPWRRYLGIE